MFKFNKSVDKPVDQDLEEGELSDNDVVDHSAPPSIQPKKMLHPNHLQQSGSQEYVFETIKNPQPPERKKDRKEQKIQDKAKEKRENYYSKSRSPDSRTYQSPNKPPTQPYYPYNQGHYQSYPQVDHRPLQYLPSHNVSHKIPFQGKNYPKQDQNWGKNTYQNYQYSGYPMNGYHVPQNGINQAGSSPYQSNFPTNATQTQKLLINNSNLYKTMQSYQQYPQNYSSHQKIDNNYAYVSSNATINQAQSLQQKRRLYEQEKLEKKKIRENKIKKVHQKINKQIQGFISNSAQSEDQKRKEEVSTILYTLKGLLKEQIPEKANVGEATLELIDEKIEGDLELKKTVFYILQLLQAKTIIQKLKERQVEKNLIGNKKLKQYKQLIKDIDKKKLKDPRIISQ